MQELIEGVKRNGRVPNRGVSKFGFGGLVVLVILRVIT